MKNKLAVKKAWLMIRHEVFTSANLITLSRILLVYPVKILFTRGLFLWGLIIGILAGLTDFFDGWVSRKFNQITGLGKAFDPLADKIFIIVIAWSLWPDWLAKKWFAIIIIGEVFLVSLVGLKGVLWKYTKRVKLGANKFGKIKFNFQCALMVLFFLEKSKWVAIDHQIITGFLGLALFFAALSIIVHIIKAAKEMIPK